MNLSEMTKSELIEHIQQLQFSLTEAQKVIQQLTKDLPAYRRGRKTEIRENDVADVHHTLTQELQKRDLYKLYDNTVAADIFNGEDDKAAKQNAFNTIVEALAIEGVVIKKDSLHKHFPDKTNTK